MAGIAQRAAILSIARFANYGLTLLSPVILVRLLTVEQFGQYREFVVYASFLQLVAAFSFAESLLYFIPAQPGRTWRIANQTILLTAFSSLVVAALLVAADFVTHGAIAGAHLWPLATYVLLFVNIDIWEYFCLATHRSTAVFGYSVGRLMARMVTVVGLAWLTRDVEVIVWGLVMLEAVRLAGAALVWRRMDRSATEPAGTGLVREQLRYCLPAGFAMMLFLANRNVGTLTVAEALGPVALAHYTIGTYAEYLYIAMGNSIALVLLSEMVKRNAGSRAEGLELWKRATVVNCMLLMPVAVLGMRYAEPVIVTVFGEAYRESALVMQVHMLFMLRACLDFSPAVRAINQTRALVYSNLASLVFNAAALAVLVPRWGIAGAAAALVLSSYVEAAVLGVACSRGYGVGLGRFVPWRRVGTVALAAVVAGLAILPDWDGMLGIAGVALAMLVYTVCFIVLLHLLRVSELGMLLDRVRRTLGLSPPVQG